jgi:hypothetical protein
VIDPGSESGQILLRNEVEAALVETILRQDGVPHFIRSYHDRAYDGIWQFQMGWGQVETPVEYMGGIRALLSLLRSNKTLPALW